MAATGVCLPYGSRVSSTGYGPVPPGRWTSARGTVPSHISAGTSTAPLPRRSPGVSVSPGKKAIFVAALARSMEDTSLAFERAAKGVDQGEQVLQAMANAYARLVSAHPETLQMQIQGHSVVAAAEAQGDDQIGTLVRTGWTTLWQTVHLAPGADTNETTALQPSCFPPIAGEALA